MAIDSVDSDDDLKTGTGAPLPSGTAPGASHQAPEQTRLTYQVILRHLAKFRDGARTLLDIFDKQAPSEAALKAPVPPFPKAVRKVEPESKGSLELRIERHMGAVDRALTQIRDLNPESMKRADLPPDVRELIDTKERTMRDIVSAELHFWSAFIENSPLSKFDEIERAWIGRMIRLANLLGVDRDHQEHLNFLKDWASHEHH
jgi:hypothetical protein